MGGTFDPIHYGHLVAAESARTAFELTGVLFVPAAAPPHKASRHISPAEHRLMMTQLATITNPYFTVSRIELDREGTSFTVDTLRTLQMNEPDVELYFITGADAVLQIFTWKDAKEILSMATVIAATRPGYSLGELRTLQHHFGTDLSKIHILEVPALAISSSDIRKRLHKQQSIRYLVPEPVEYYVRKNKLYGAE